MLSGSFLVRQFYSCKWCPNGSVTLVVKNLTPTFYTNLHKILIPAFVQELPNYGYLYVFGKFKDVKMHRIHMVYQNIGNI